MYTGATRSSIGGASRIVLLIELDREIEIIVSVAMVAAGGFFGCCVGEIVTWNGGMARDPLDEDRKRNGVDGIVDEGCSRMG